MLIALTLVAATLCVFSACDDNGDPADTTTAATTTAATTTAATTESTTESTTASTTGSSVPSGYKLFSNDDISFAYPSTWEKDEEDGMALLQGTQNTNNITVVSEDATDIYDDMTAQSFEEEYAPIYELMGMTLTNVKVSHKTTNGLDVIVISYDAEISGVTMKQTQYVITVGEYTYTVSITETVADPALAENVFNTLKEVK